ncbi:adenine phosphoribosyltransferase [Alphaproteobacteria bacterium]|nr:adenine phosphoribosyltransferase [Alphaproteobacteria bacterium]
MNDTVRIIKDFPKKGINFYDISSLLAKPKEFKKSIDKMISITKKMKPTAIAGIDSRGFLFASIVAYSLKLKLIIIRKKGKLPGKTYRNSYKLEYGNNTLEIQRDFLNYKDRVVVIDDIFATSGTMNASCKLVEKTKAKVLGTIVLIELNFLKGRSKIKYNLESLIKVNT